MLEEKLSCKDLKTDTGLPWCLRQERIRPQRGRPGFDPWVGKIPWRREGLPTPVYFPGEAHGKRSLTGYSPWDRRVRHDREAKHGTETDAGLVSNCFSAIIGQDDLLPAFFSLQWT